MRGNEILLCGNPKGVFLEGIVSGTPAPGTVMVPTTAVDVNGDFTWQAWTASTGAAGLQAVLLPDQLQGQLPTTAYVTAKRCFLYVPLPGEFMNMLFADVAGTGDIHTVGDLMGVQTSTGLLVINSSFTSTPWMCMETIAAPTANTLVMCMRI